MFGESQMKTETQISAGKPRGEFFPVWKAELEIGIRYLRQDANEKLASRVAAV